MSRYCTYIILTSNKKYYVGHTNNLDDRFKRHLNGSGPKFTAQNKPIKVVWFQNFNTEMDAVRREKQLKGWTREKKEKLIDGVWK
jgi:putative endonuclease